MNIHPALLPSFGGKGMYGRQVHQAVLDHGCKVSGCTVHFVDATYDTGPIILQRTCPVEEDDTPETLAHRVFEEEKIAYPEAIRLFQAASAQRRGAAGEGAGGHGTVTPGGASVPAALFDRGFDSVEEFECAAAQRFAEALSLDRHSYKLAAVYLYGYSVEMRVKAAFFRSAGYGASRQISVADRNDARAMWQILGLLVPPGQHDILGWAQLAVAARATPPHAYGALGLEIINHATTIYLIWRETLRYRSTTPTSSERRSARTVAEWFERNYHRMG